MFQYPSDMAVPVRNLSIKYWLPDNPRLFQQQMLLTLNSLLKVTKKIAQRNFLEKLRKMNLLTQHAAYIRRLVVSANKAKSRTSKKNLDSIGDILMEIPCNDVKQD